MATVADGAPRLQSDSLSFPSRSLRSVMSTSDNTHSPNSVLPGYSIVYKAPLVSHVKVTALQCFCVKDQPWFYCDLQAHCLHSLRGLRAGV